MELSSTALAASAACMAAAGLTVFAWLVARSTGQDTALVFAVDCVLSSLFFWLLGLFGLIYEATIGR